MTDGFIRHLISFICLFIFGLVYVVAYYAGANGWWFLGITILIIYPIVYKLVDV
ncbi:MAG: hypothetical protein KBD15_03665 [Candidatus Magasanikbacteria bacterium]|jgi:hypothetical protein|nr:hypothetical protein [Candidatus Magasanikbacteria bacterium]